MTSSSQKSSGSSLTTGEVFTKLFKATGMASPTSSQLLNLGQVLPKGHFSNQPSGSWSNFDSNWLSWRYYRFIDQHGNVYITNGQAVYNGDGSAIGKTIIQTNNIDDLIAHAESGYVFAQRAIAEIARRKLSIPGKT